VGGLDASVGWEAVTPDSDSPDAPDRITRPSRRAIALGVVGVLAAGVVVAVAGFLGAPTASSTAPQSERLSTHSGQLTTYPLHDEKEMRRLAKGVPAVSPAPTTAP
jgi:hypothetical protein